MPRKVSSSVRAVLEKTDTDADVAQSKNRIPASATQNRDNQRRSRARHRQFVKDLQDRVSRYEREGIQASIELQRVARALKHENQGLRSLLRRRGVSQSEIDRHLRFGGREDDGTSLSASISQAYCSPGREVPLAGADESCTAEHSSPTTPPQSKDILPALGAPTPSGLVDSTRSQSRVHLPALPSPNIPATLAKTATAQGSAVEVPQETTPHSPDRASISFICNGDTIHTGHPGEILPPVSDCFCPPETPIPGPALEGKGISCKRAVDLMAGIQHNIHADEIKRWLRCGASDDCEVQSSRLFLLMDKIT